MRCVVVARTKETLATGHFMSVINILMQLRKVCNHPDLFDLRPTVSPFHMEGIVFTTASPVLHALDQDPMKVGISTIMCIALQLALCRAGVSNSFGGAGHTAIYQSVGGPTKWSGGAL